MDGRVKHKIAVFASGNGSNFEAIAAACSSGELYADVALLVCDKRGAPVIERADRFGIPVLVVSPNFFGSKEHYERFILEKLEEHEVELICLAGYMRIVSDVLLGAYEGRIINIHPSLLPSFKGAHAIRDAFEYGVKVYGVTVHYVNNEVDGGRIIMQRGIEYYGKDIEELEAKIHAIEHKLYVESINMIFRGDNEI